MGSTVNTTFVVYHASGATGGDELALTVNKTSRDFRRFGESGVPPRRGAGGQFGERKMGCGAVELAPALTFNAHRKRPGSRCPRAQGGQVLLATTVL